MAAAIPLPDVEDPWMIALSLTPEEWINVLDRKEIIEEQIELFLNLVGAPASYPPFLTSLLC